MGGRFAVRAARRRVHYDGAHVIAERARRSRQLFEEILDEHGWFWHPGYSLYLDQLLVLEEADE
jgi:hypothetical protein